MIFLTAEVNGGNMATGRAATPKKINRYSAVCNVLSQHAAKSYTLGPFTCFILVLVAAHLWCQWVAGMNGKLEQQNPMFCLLLAYPRSCPLITKPWWLKRVQLVLIDQGFQKCNQTFSSIVHFKGSVFESCYMIFWKQILRCVMKHNEDFFLSLSFFSQWVSSTKKKLRLHLRT